MTTVLKSPPKPQSNPIWLQNYPDYVNWDGDLETYTLVDMWNESAKKFADKDVIAWAGSHMTYGELDAKIQTMKAQLQSIGVKKGDHVGLFLLNSPWSFVCYQAVLGVGGVVVNFSPLYTPDELANQSKDSHTQYMFTVDMDPFFSNAKGLLDSGGLKKLIVLPFAPPEGKASFETSDTLLTPDSIGDVPPATPVDVAVDDLAVLQYTGGTTGVSKGAMLTHANLSANVSQTELWMTNAKVGEVRMACVLPLFHVFAMTVCMNYLIKMGGCALIRPRFDPADAAQFLRDEKCTFFPGVPTMFLALTMVPDDMVAGLDKTLKTVVSGGAPLPAEIKSAFEGKMGVEMLEGYGLSETSPVASLIPEGMASVIGSIGFPVPQTEFSLRDLEDPENPVPQGERGEVCIKGPQVMSGYWNRPELHDSTFTKDGFFRTGDVAYHGDDGYTFIVDRIKDLILCSGFNVYPRHIEEALFEHPDITEVIVIGIPHPEKGEVPKAYVVAKDQDNPPAVDDLMAYLKGKIKSIEMPAEIEFRSELPKTAVGKLSKKDLREEL